MRFARELFVLAAVLAAMAFGASSASAVEVENAAAVHCGTVVLNGHGVSGGCPVEAVSERETQVQAFVSGVGFVTISTCADHLEAAIGEDGTGYMFMTTTGMAGPPCTRRQCDEANMTIKPWRIRLTSTSSLEIDICLRQYTDMEGSLGTRCHAVFAVTPNNLTGAHEISANPAPCDNLGGGVRVIAHWNIAPDPGHPMITIF